METEPRTLFVSLARGGSKRLPGKNLLEVGGVPLVGRAVRTARQAARRLGNTHRIVVSTDCARIAHVAREHGAETPFLRPAELAGDTATSVEAMRHVVDWYSARGETFTEVVLVQPTSPLSRAEDVVHAVELFRQRPGESVVTVREATHSGPGLSFTLAGDTLFDATPHEDAAGFVELNGAVYVCSARWLCDYERLCEPGRTRAIVMPPERSVDVDSGADLELARTLWEQSLLWREGRCLVIAEAGVNHNGCLDTARRMVESAANAGADAVKFQVFSAKRLATRKAPKAAYQRRRTSDAESQFDMLKKLELPPNDYATLMNDCRDRGILFLASAFGEEDVDLLDELDVAAIKLGSAEITNLPLLFHAGATLRPIILSTGGSWLHEVAQAVHVLTKAGCSALALLHCVSSYPAEIEDVNLRAMQTLQRAFDLPTGFSDHTEGIPIAVAAVVAGARIIEKHFTLSRAMPGPDHSASLEPDELRDLVRAVRNVEAALGDGIKRPARSELDTRRAARRSLVAATALRAGTTLQRGHLVAKRPGTGICPAQTEQVLGQRLSRDLAADEQLNWADLQPQGEAQ